MVRWVIAAPDGPQLALGALRCGRNGSPIVLADTDRLRLRLDILGARHQCGQPKLFEALALMMYEMAGATEPADIQAPTVIIVMGDRVPPLPTSGALRGPYQLPIAYRTAYGLMSTGTSQRSPPPAPRAPSASPQGSP